MPVKVVVTGSYREQEQRDNRFVLGQKVRFEQTARAIGRKLAEEKCTLLVAWSEGNPDSQYNRRSADQPNHPYWQTADYHALDSYLDAIQQSPELIAEGAGVEMKISGREGRSCNPFGKQLDDYRRIPGVNVDVNIPHEFPERRSRMLKKLASEAEVFIVIGGGNATEFALHYAARRQVLLPLGFAGGVGQQAIAELSDDFKRQLNIDLNTKDVDIIIAQLPVLINLITSRNTYPNQTSETAMTSPNNGNNEPPAPSTQRQPSNNVWSFLDNSRTEHPVIFWILVVGIIISIIYMVISLFRGVSGGKVEFTPGGGIKPVQPSPTTSASPPLSETKNTDNFEVTVNYRCIWKSPGKNSQPVDKATVKTFINGQLNSSDDTNSNGYVSFKMTSTDEVKAEITHLDARDVPIKDDVKLTPIDLESKKSTIDRQSCLLFAKDKVKR